MIRPNQYRENYFVKLVYFLWENINRLFRVVERDIIKISVLKEKTGSFKWEKAEIYVSEDD